MTKPFPDTNEFRGANTPTRFESDITDLVVEGAIPAEISGAWFQMIPDPYFPPRFEQDNFFAGDGVICKFSFEDGKVDFKNRYVQTDRLKAEKAAGKALFGFYHNPFTDDDSVKDVPRTVSNTTPVWHAGKLHAVKEDGLGIEVNPFTLETGDWNTYKGQLRSQTTTAHPRIDYDTGEMFINGYEADGIATNDISFAVVDKNGELVKEEWFKTPDYVSMMHDFIVTKEHVVFPLFPTTVELERLKEGGSAWKFEPEKPAYIGIMPRDGSVKDMVWFKGPGKSGYHYMNGFSKDGKVYIDFSYTTAHQFPFVRDPFGQVPKLEELQDPYVRWEFDLSKPGSEPKETVLANVVGDFPRVADKDHMKDYDVGYLVNYDPANGAPCMICIAHMGFNTLTRVEVKTGNVRSFSFGPQTTMAEPIHIASKQPGHEGYLMTTAFFHDKWLSEVAVFEAEHLEKGPIARVKLPFRLRHQLHGTWVSSEQLATAR